MARPRKKWTKEKVAEVYKQLEEYILNADDINKPPSLSEFAFLHRYPRSKLYKFPELNELRDLLNAKREFMYERMGIDNKNKPTFAIFALKQLGWTDRQDMNVTGEVTGKFEIKLPKQKSRADWEKQQQQS